MVGAWRSPLGVEGEPRAPGAGRDRGTRSHPSQDAPGGAPGSGAVAEAAVTSDQRVGGAVVPERGLIPALELRGDPARERLAQLHAPLVERVDAPRLALADHDLSSRGRPNRTARLCRAIIRSSRVITTRTAQPPPGAE